MREDFAIRGGVERQRSRSRKNRGRESSVLPRLFSMLERATLLRGARRFGAALAQRRFGRRQFLQRSDSGSRRICPSSEEFRASDACEAQPAFAASCAPVSAGGKELIGLRSATSWIGCRGALRAFARIHRSNRRVRLHNQPMVAGNGAEAKASVTTGLRPVFLTRAHCGCLPNVRPSAE